MTLPLVMTESVPLTAMRQDVSGLLKEIRETLRMSGSEKGRLTALRYFKEQVDPYGVSMPEVRSIAREMMPHVKLLDPRERARLCTDLMKSTKLEEPLMAAIFEGRFAKKDPDHSFQLASEWAERWVNNWACCDGLCSSVVEPCLREKPELAMQLLVWANAKSQWKRRASAAALTKPARAGQNTDLIFRIAARLMEAPEEKVQQGVGWLLKETYPAKSRETVQFLLSWKVRTTRLVLRYAAEKMTPGDKAKVMAK